MARPGADRGPGSMLLLLPRGPSVLLLLVLAAVLPAVLGCSSEYSEAVDEFCLSRFSLDMEQLDPNQWCSWEDTVESYSELTNCSYLVALRLGCFWPNRDVDRFFVDVHRKYFGDCALIGRSLRDPPSEVSGPFILGPVLVTLLMTALVVWRSKRSEGIVAAHGLQGAPVMMMYLEPLHRFNEGPEDEPRASRRPEPALHIL